jgi:hypothetical protein
LTSLLSPPDSLTSRQRALVWITALLAALTRLAALAKTPWDWDEVQFALGVREYSVGWPFHHPHPPGFPIYMLAAKIVRPLAGSDFAACQTIVFLAACTLFPLAFFLARELRFSFATSYGGALLFVFLPNIWYYGGTAFSDIPGLAALLAAVMMLLRGCHSPRAFLGGAALLGIAAGVRPQALLIGCAPFLAASWCQLNRRAAGSGRRAGDSNGRPSPAGALLRIVAAGMLVIVIVGACYVGAALASYSIAGYRLGLSTTKDWVRQHDAYFSPGRPSLWTLTERYFVRPILDGKRLSVTLSILAAAGLIAGCFRARTGVWLAMAIFFPFALFGWLMLDYNSIHRYSTAYAFLWAILPAHAIGVVATPLRRYAPLAQLAIIGALAGRCAWWTLPALRDVRTSVSPPVAVLSWARDHVSPRQTLWIDGALAPYVEPFLTNRPVVLIADRTKLQSARPGDFFLAEGLEPGATVSFRRARERTWNVGRRRYFETSAVPMTNLWAFGDGWYPPESDGTRAWRWMGPHSEALLPPLAGRARLAMTLGAAGGTVPDVEVRLNDALLGRFRLTPEFRQYAWVVDARSDAPNRLVIVSSAAVNLAKQGVSDDARDLSVQVTALSWHPIR